MKWYQIGGIIAVLLLLFLGVLSSLPGAFNFALGIALGILNLAVTVVIGFIVFLGALVLGIIFRRLVIEKLDATWLPGIHLSLAVHIVIGGIAGLAIGFLWVYLYRFFLQYTGLGFYDIMRALKLAGPFHIVDDSVIGYIGDYIGWIILGGGEFVAGYLFGDPNIPW